MLHNRVAGISIIEFLIALLVLIFVITGITKGFIDLLKRQKQVELHNRARALLEDIGSNMSTLSSPEFSALNLDLSSKTGTCVLNGTCDFESSCFTGNYSNAISCDIAQNGYSCLYCLTGQKLEAQNCTSNCTCPSGYSIFVDYDFYNLKDNETQTLTGIGICLRTRFIDPISKQTKEYRKLILNFRVYP